MTALFSAFTQLLLPLNVGTPVLFAAHPTIAAESAIGRGIDDMAINNGRLYLGYGDYSANTGPTAVAYVDLATAEPGVEVTAPTEEINTYRTFRGHLFAPWIDPTVWGSAVNGGFSTSEGGWSNKFTFPAGHIYDYTELGDSRFLAGAIAYGGAGVWQSDAGGPWKLVQSEESVDGATGWERFYWAITLRGQVFVQAKHNGGTEELPSGTMFKMKSFDGTRWKTERASINGVTAASDIEVFKDRAYYQRSVFDGNRTRRSDIPITYVRDWYNAGDYLYAIDNNGTVVRTDGSGWESLGQVDLAYGLNVNSLAVHGGYVYVGTDTGLVYRSTL